MLSKVVIYPYKIGSKSAKDLAIKLSQLFNGNRVRVVKAIGKYRPKPHHVCINYGATIDPSWNHSGKWLNRKVKDASNKLQAFGLFAANNVCTPLWTADRLTAELWIQQGHMVVCRTMLSAHSGRGIVLAKESNELVTCPLYVQYKKKKKEYRVHVFNGEVIDVAEKRRKTGESVSDNGYYIRNHSNGWVFCRDNISLPDSGRNLCLEACRALGLDFGAVDLIWNQKEDKYYVLEVNTAPGLEGSTLTNYANAIRKAIYG